MQFNDGRPYHGSEDVEKGRLRGATGDTDYFRFFCPKCSGAVALQVPEYEVRHESKDRFVIAFKLRCEKCEFTDFVKTMGFKDQ